MIPKLLSECGDLYVIDNSKKDRYQVQIEEGENQIVVMGFLANKPASNYKHPNISATVKRIHEFKHYRKHGSKFWTSRAGVDHYLVVPRNKITLLPEKGYSYVKAEINGVKVSFNVSGGTGNGWTDWLGTIAHTSVNHKLSDLKKIAEVSIRQDITDIRELSEDEIKTWNRLAFKANPKIKNAICKMIEEKKNPVIELVPGYDQTIGYGVDLNRKWKVERISSDTCRHGFIGGIKSIVTKFDEFGLKCVKERQIDWYLTAQKNHLIA